MRKITSAFSLATLMLLSLSGVQAAEMNNDTMINPADMPSSLSHDQATNTQMNAAMDATMKNDAIQKEAVMAPKDKMMKTAAMGAKMKAEPDSSMTDAAMNQDATMAPKDKMMKTAAMGTKMKNAAINKDPLPGGKQ